MDEHEILDDKLKKLVSPLIPIIYIESHQEKEWCGSWVDQSET